MKIDDTFIIDNTLGRDVKFSLDVLSGDLEAKKNLKILFENGTELFNSDSFPDSTYVKSFPMLKVSHIAKVRFLKDCGEVIRWISDRN